MKIIKYSFNTKNNVTYIVTIQNRLDDKTASIDFEARKKYQDYVTNNTDDYDVINVFNTVIDIVKLHINDVDKFYIASNDKKRLRLYKNIAKRNGFKVYDMNNSILIYLKNNE